MAVVRSSSREYNSPERRSERVMLKAPVVILTRGADCSVANYTRRSEGLASRSIVGNGVMEAVPVTGIPQWDRGMGQGEMRIFRFDLGQLKTQASQIPKRCGTSWEAVGIVFSSDSCDRSRRSRTPVYARRNGNGNLPGDQGGARLPGTV